MQKSPVSAPSIAFHCTVVQCRTVPGPCPRMYATSSRSRKSSATQPDVTLPVFVSDLDGKRVSVARLKNTAADLAQDITSRPRSRGNEAPAKV